MLTEFSRRIHDKTIRRKLRLFACACVRLVWHDVTNPRIRNAVEVAEHHADGRKSDEELESAYFAACDAENEVGPAIENMDPELVTLEVLNREASVSAAVFAAAPDLANGLLMVIRFLSGTVIGAAKHPYGF